MASLDYKQPHTGNEDAGDLVNNTDMLEEQLQPVTLTSKLASILNATYSDLLHEDANTTEIILVRHGQTVWNLTHRLQGQGNSELTDVGTNGALKVGKKLYWLHKNDRKIDFFYASPIKRAKQTAQIILAQFTNCNDKLEIQYDDRIMERNFGNFQGITMGEIKKNKPKIYATLHSDIEYKPPGNGESMLEVTNRCTRFLAEIASRHHGKRILVVCHGGVLQAIFNDILVRSCLADRTFHCKNCAINIVQRDHSTGKWYVTLLGDDNYGDYQRITDSDRQINDTHQHMWRDLTTSVVGFVLGCVVCYTAFQWRRPRR